MNDPTAPGLDDQVPTARRARSRAPAFEPPPVIGPAPVLIPPSTGTTRAGLGGGLWATGNRFFLAAAAAIALAAAAVGIYFIVTAGGAGHRSTAAGAVTALLRAGESNDVAKARSVLCTGDLAFGVVSHLQSSGTITSYSLGGQRAANGLTTVTATYTTKNPDKTVTQQFPVVNEGGAWKVCFTKVLAAAPTALPTSVTSAFGTSASAPEGPVGSSSNAVSPPLPSIPALAGLCSGATSGVGVASTYMGAAELGITQIAQSCVYRDAVAESVTERLAGHLYSPAIGGADPSTVDFRSTDGSTDVTVTTAQEPDGFFYVVGVLIH